MSKQYSYNNQRRFYVQFNKDEVLHLEENDSYVKVMEGSGEVICYVPVKHRNEQEALDIAHAISLISIMIEIIKDHRDLGIMYDSTGRPLGRKPPLKASLMSAYKVLQEAENSLSLLSR